MKFAPILLSIALTTPMAFAGPTILDTWHEIQSRQDRNRPLNTADKILQRLMYTDIETGFTDVTVREAFERIEQLTRCRLRPLYISPTEPEGLDPDFRITMATSKRPALDMIEAVIEAIEVGGVPATWQLRHSAFEISTKTRLGARNMQVLVTYPVLDIVEEVPDYNDPPNLNLGGGGAGGGGAGGGGVGGGAGGGGFGGGGGAGGGGVPDDLGGRPLDERMQELMDLITTMVEPEAWEANGGSYATMRPWKGTLIIRAPHWIQRQLGDMRIPPPPAGKAPRGLQYEGSSVQVIVPVR